MLRLALITTTKLCKVQRHYKSLVLTNSVYNQSNLTQVSLLRYNDSRKVQHQPVLRIFQDLDNTIRSQNGSRRVEQQASGTTRHSLQCSLIHHLFRHTTTSLDMKRMKRENSLDKKTLRKLIQVPMKTKLAQETTKLTIVRIRRDRPSGQFLLKDLRKQLQYRERRKEMILDQATTSIHLKVVCHCTSITDRVSLHLARLETVAQRIKNIVKQQRNKNKESKE